MPLLTATEKCNDVRLLAPAELALNSLRDAILAFEALYASATTSDLKQHAASQMSSFHCKQDLLLNALRYEGIILEETK